MKYKIKLIILFMIVLLLLSVIVSGHKDSSESSQSTSSYEVSLGLIPAQIVEGKPQLIFVRAVRVDQDAPASKLKVEFTIHSLHNPEISNQAKAVYEDGIYSLTRTFQEKGSYMVMAKVSDGERTITQISRNIHVEPDGPSIYFWLYMLTALIVGAIIASKSHEF